MEKNNAPAPPPPPPAVAQLLERTVSMEEPKTLSEAELAAFRAAALHVINTHTPEEAARIFMGGLETAAPKAEQLEPAAKEEK